MKYCANCGSKMEDNERFCGECGAEFGTVHRDSGKNVSGNPFKVRNTEKPKKKAGSKLGIILAWIFLFPLMLIYSFIRTNKINTKVKFAVVGFLVIMFVVSGLFGNSEDESLQSNNNLSSNTNNSVGKVEDAPKDEIVEEVILLKGVDNELASYSIKSASEQINLNIEDARGIKKEDPWAGGDRYSLNYNANKVIIYMRGTDKVESINVGEVKVFEDGYEPLNIEEFITNTKINENITTISKDLIKSMLNYPETAKFPWLDWSYGRMMDIYAVSSQVEAKNAFGVESKIPFYIEYRLDETSTTPVYVVLDGKIVYGDSSKAVQPEKVKIADEEAIVVEDGSFEIRYGEKGEYGKTANLNGTEDIYYYIPQGKYSVSTDMNLATVLVLKKEPYRNSDGKLEHNVVSMNSFNSSSKIKEIEIGSDEIVYVTVNSIFKFLPID